jgi:hypothetical protein
MSDDNIVGLPAGWGLMSDLDFTQGGKYTKVKFPVSSEHKGHLLCECMWVIIKSGDARNGTGELDNEPVYSDFTLGQIIRYQEADDEIIYVETLAEGGAS